MPYIPDKFKLRDTKCIDVDCSLYFLSVGYLTTLSVSRLYKSDDRMTDECAAVGGMRTDSENQSTGRKSAPTPLFTPQISHGLNWD
jgi:hypothetical protein